MSYIMEVKAGEDIDIVRVCSVHEWASEYHPKELRTMPDECPGCNNSDKVAGRKRYQFLSSQGLVGDRP